MIDPLGPSWLDYFNDERGTLSGANLLNYGKIKDEIERKKCAWAQPM